MRVVSAWTRGGARLFPIGLLAALGVLGAACSKRVPPEAAAQNFFEQIGRGEVAQAYESSAFAFKAQQSAKVFSTTAKEMGLTEMRSVTSDPPEIQGRSAAVRVTVTTRSGKSFPLLMTLNDENGVWRVFSLKSPVDLETGIAENRFSLVGKGNSFNSAVNQPMPSEKAIKQMVTESLLEFNEAIQNKSFEKFYDTTAHAWQQQLTLGKLSRAFQPFIDQGVNMASIATVEPVLDPPPSVTTEGLLIVSGSYPTQPYRVVFQVKYIYELPRWRIFGLDVNLYK